MPRCPKCKNTVARDDRFCSRCGFSPYAASEPQPPAMRIVREEPRQTLEPKNPVVRVLLTVFLLLVAFWLCGNAVNRGTLGPSIQWFLNL